MTEEFYIIWNRQRGLPIICPRGFTLDQAISKAKELGDEFGRGDYFVLKNVCCVSNSMGENTVHEIPICE